MLPSFKNLNSDAEIKAAIVEVVNAAGPDGVDNVTLRHHLSVNAATAERLAHELASEEDALLSLQLQGGNGYFLTRV